MKHLKLLLSKWKDIWDRFSGNGIYPHELAFILDTRLRRFILTPEELIKNLNLSKQSKVLEIGSGPGYFSIDVSKKIPMGKLIPFDIQKEMLLKCLKKVAKAEIKNVFPVRGNGAILPFKEYSFDVVFMVTVLGEITDPESCIKSINRILQKGGILSITEMKGDPDLLSVEEIKEIVLNNNFDFSKLITTKKGFTINFSKK